MPKHASRSAAFVLCSLFLTSCTAGGGSPGAAPAGGAPGRGGRGAGGPVPVVTARAVQKTVPVVVPAVGTVEAVSSVQIRSQVTGQLTAIHFTEGRDVRQGDSLFSLDPRPFQSSLLQAQAVLARDAATLQNAKAQQSRADAADHLVQVAYCYQPFRAKENAGECYHTFAHIASVPHYPCPVHSTPKLC